MEVPPPNAAAAQGVVVEQGAQKAEMMKHMMDFMWSMMEEWSKPDSDWGSDWGQSSSSSGRGKGKGKGKGKKGKERAPPRRRAISDKLQATGEIMAGKIKSLADNHFFIEHDYVKKTYGKDVFSGDTKAIQGKKVGDGVIFDFVLSQKGDPQAANVKPLADVRKALCTNYLQTGMCKFGVTCNFAHTEEELDEPPTRRNLPSLCKEFLEGTCQFGVWCHYAHALDELDEDMMAVENFLMQNSSLDDRVGKTLRHESTKVQRLVIEKGHLNDLTNPSAACMGRIREARGHAVVEFGMLNGLDEHCIQLIKKQDITIQKQVIGAGPVEEWGGTGTPVSKVHAKLKKLGAQMEVRYDSAEDLALAVNSFCEKNGCDPQSCETLKLQASHVQEAVLNAGNVSGKNPSALLMNRIKQCGGGPMNAARAAAAAAAAQQPTAIVPSAATANVFGAYPTPDATMMNNPALMQNPAAAYGGYMAAYGMNNPAAAAYGAAYMQQYAAPQPGFAAYGAPQEQHQARDRSRSPYG